tara:strand:- start:2291 stop:2518 length:228 start_codon:yes stop_codon:yes gene_type:complete
MVHRENIEEAIAFLEERFYELPMSEDVFEFMKEVSLNYFDKYTKHINKDVTWDDPIRLVMDDDTTIYLTKRDNNL